MPSLFVPLLRDKLFDRPKDRNSRNPEKKELGITTHDQAKSLYNNLRKKISVYSVRDSYLWTGDSEFCACGHHVTKHRTNPISWTLQVWGKNITSTCSGASYRKAICTCRFFNPYCTRKLDEQSGEVAAR